MARKSETLQLVIRAKETASKEFKKLDKALDITRKRLTSLRKTAFNLKTAFVGVGIGLLAKNFIAAASTSEQYRLRLKVLLGSQEEGNRLFKEMADYAGKVAFEYEDVMGSATALAGVMRDGVDEVKQWMPLIGDLAAASGLSIQDTTSQIIRMYSAGAASADLFRERGILAMLGFQAGVSYSAEETKKRLIEAWKEPTSKFRGAATELSGTWKGLLSMVSDRWFQFRNLVMESGLFAYIKDGLDLILEGISNLKSEGDIDDWAKQIANSIITTFEKMLLGTAAFYDGIKPVIDDIKTALLSIWESFKSLPPWVQKVGLVGAFLGGKTGKVIVAGTLLSLSHIKNLAAASALVQAQLMPQELLNKLMWKPGELDAYIKEFDEAHNEIIGTTEKTGDAAKDATEPVKDFFKAFSDAETATQKVQVLLAYLRDLKKEETTPPKDAKTPTPTTIPTATDEAKTKSHTARLVAATKTALLILTNAYKQGEVTLQQYFDRRRELIETQYAEEMAAMRAAAEAETDPSKRLAIEDKIFAKEETHKRTLINLTNQQLEAEKALAQKKIEIDQAMADLRLRAKGEKGGGLLQAGFDEELAEMDARHAEELQGFKDLLNEKLAAEMGYADEAAALRDIQGMQRLEKEKLLADQERRIRESQLENARNIAGGMESIFADLYEMGGKKQKEFFYLSKAAALAEAGIKTAQGVIGALGSPPYGLGAMVMAGVIAAMGAIQIAKITAQTLATGGPVKGYSSSDTADNIPVMATAGEYMQPVKTVQYYGSQVMEAMRQRMIPREIFAGLTLPNFTIPQPMYAFAGGGPIPSQAPGGEDMQPGINIINVTDPRELDQYLATSAGQNAILNVLSSRAEAVKRVLR